MTFWKSISGLALASLLSGVGIVGASVFMHDLATALSGVGSITIALALQQVSTMRKEIKELKEKVGQLEEFIFELAKEHGGVR